MSAPRCGRPMLRYKNDAMPGEEKKTTCGRPEGHRGDCRSLEACRRYHAADSRRITANRRQDRLAGIPRNQYRTRATGSAGQTVSRSGCGTYLAYLLHQAKAETPCDPCVQAAAERLDEKTARRQAPEPARADRSTWRSAA